MANTPTTETKAPASPGGLTLSNPDAKQGAKSETRKSSPALPIGTSGKLRVIHN